MPDELDMMLQGNDTPSASLAGDDQGANSNQGQPIEQQTPEEVEFNSLSGTAQERFRRLTRDKRELAERLENLERVVGTQVPPAPRSGFRDPQEEAAIRTLADKGIATDEKVNKVVDDRFNSLRWEFEQNRLESKYDGSHGEPQYSREEVEEFIQSHPQYKAYAPEDVFRFKMFPDEFMNLEIQKRGTKPGGRSQSLRPTKAQQQAEALTPEYIEQRLQQPDGRQWYDEHLDEINVVLQKMGQAQ